MLEVTERFRVKYHETETGCWIWFAAKDAGGYGRFKWNGRIDGAHRVSWEMANGAVPRQMDVLHRCNVKACVNPAHLYLGTQKDNMRDAMRDGLWVCPDRSGIRNAAAKITPETARAIRLEYAQGDVSQAMLAAKFGMHQTNVSRIVRKANWRD